MRLFQLSLSRSLLSISSVVLVACGGGTSLAADPEKRPDGTTAIAAIQGSSRASPLRDQRVTISGIVSGDFQSDDTDESRDLGGFFVQAEVPDDDLLTSDGIFVFDRNASSTDVCVGDKVTVTGTVSERFGETQITASVVAVSGKGSVQPTEITLPAGTTVNSDGDIIVDLEHLEGMLVTLAESATVTDVFSVERFGMLVLSSGTRLFQYTNEFAPDVAGYTAHIKQSAAASIVLDDGLVGQNVPDNRYTRLQDSRSNSSSVRVGDTVTSVVGNLRYSRGSGPAGKETYRIMPTADPLLVRTNPRPSAPPDVGGNITIASFNALNYFTTVDRGRDECGPQGDNGCRGADSVAEFERQRAKTVNTLVQMDADVVGLMEVENNGNIALQSIVDEMNRHLGTESWDFIDTGSIGSDAITVGVIYRVTAVRPAGSFELLTSAVSEQFNDEKNRPVLAQSFDVIESDERFTVAVSHLKSKGSPCDELDDPNRGDGQANCNVTRTSAAAALAQWLLGDPTGSGDPDFLIIGDLNAYHQEDPVKQLEDAGFVNLLERFAPGKIYSFVFDGQSGALDHAFASVSLLEHVTDIAEWHINADESRALDYNLEFGRDPGLFDATSTYRASDHDPVIIGLNP